MINDIAVFARHAESSPSSIAPHFTALRHGNKKQTGLFYSASFTHSLASPDILLAYSGTLWDNSSRMSLRSRQGRMCAERIAKTYRTCGTRMFRSLEGISLVLLDRTRNTLYLWRDWIGATSLYYRSGSGTFLAGSSPKLLQQFQRARSPLRQLAAGSCLRIALDDGATEAWHHQVIPVFCSQDRLSLASRKVRKLVEEAVERRASFRKSALLLSGGPDSTILAYVLKKHGFPFDAYTVSLDTPQFPTNESGFDLFAARKAARWLGIRLHEVRLRPRDVIAALRPTILAAQSRRATLIDEMCGMLHVARRMRSAHVKVAYSGEGADSIFGSFLNVLRFIHKEDLPLHSYEAIQKDVPLTLSVVQRVFHEAGGVEVVFPYLYEPLVSYALSLPIEFRVDRSRIMKIVLRHAFRGLIPDEFLWRKKGVTRDVTHLRHVLERKFGFSRHRYFALYRRLFSPKALA